MSAGAAVRTLPGGLTCTRPQPDPALRLVCLPYAGGGPHTYRRWPAALAPALEVWTLSLPGRAGHSDADLEVRWPQLVTGVAESIARRLGGPVVLFGHSLGALVAFEVARALTAAGHPPLHLFVSGRAAPAQLAALPWIALPADDMALLDELDRRYGGVPAAVRDNPELLAWFLPSIRADLELLAGYRYRPGRLHCPITACTGVDDREASPAQLRGWAAETTGPVTTRVFDGGHFYLTESEGALMPLLRALVPGQEGSRDGTV
ncbi:thioesterase II family protein [Nocardia harenae]|uniref:thioesterase II family protein n=1 Tax=Nocardia harenae TaxID=358707 RepID=UPI000833B4FE|nr:alpha/beta fold hydrolase [Nocardia harenae]